MAAAACLSAGLNPTAPASAASCHASSGAGLLLQQQPPRRRVTCQASRRSACLLGLGLAAAFQPRPSDAAEEPEPEPANNGWWLTEFPLPVPKILNNEINNAETGTRSFLKNGIYIADIGPSFAAHAYRLRSTALDLLALEDLLGKDSTNYVTKYLRLKSTVMYYDFDKLITAAAAGDGDASKEQQQRPYLVGLANRLFDRFESLQQALAAKDDPRISDRYADAKQVLLELRASMA